MPTIYRDISPDPAQIEYLSAVPKSADARLRGIERDTGNGGQGFATTMNTMIAPPRLGRWKRALGLLAVSFVVFLWTASSFLASDLLADGSYNKPFMVTYLNSAFFMIPLIPILITKAYRQPEELRYWSQNWQSQLFRQRRQRRPHNGPVRLPANGASYSETTFPSNGSTDPFRRDYSTVESSTPPFNSSTELSDSMASLAALPPKKRRGSKSKQFGLIATARVSFEFSLLWFLANYTITACLEYTTVASSTILTSTSSIFTLFIGWHQGVESFTFRKAAGVLASFLGVALIALMDASGKNNGTDSAHRGDFPAKTRHEILLGDSLALASAGLYGGYSVLMKKRLGDGERVNMPLFFGCVGVWVVLLAWPGFILLHLTGVEPFVLPPTTRVATVLMLNSLASLLSDLSWAFAVLLTSPIVVAVGLSLSIPLSLVGQVVVHNQTTTPLYWVGAAVVVVSFVFVNLDGEGGAKKEVIMGDAAGGIAAAKWRRGEVGAEDGDAGDDPFDDEDDDDDEYDEAMATSVDRLLR